MLTGMNLFRNSLYVLYWYKSTGTDAAGPAGMNLFRNQLASSGIQSMYVGTYAHLLTNVPWSATWWDRKLLVYEAFATSVCCLELLVPGTYAHLLTNVPWSATWDISEAYTSSLRPHKLVA